MPSFDEYTWVLQFLGSSTQVTSVAERARTYQRMFFPRHRGTDDEADAFRHCLASALLVRELGEQKAKALLDAHESGWFNPSAEREMDLYNNSVGIELATKYREYQDLDLARVAALALIEGKLKVLKPGGVPHGLEQQIRGSLANPDRW